tara:strand:+ start:5543 stop:7093 length:1551 start_codon:yes stop_codon:yes gene_type:complete
MPVTFNSNNNYSVDIISEENVDNLLSVKYSASSNTPFVEIKITPTNPETNPVLASNIKIDGIIPDFAWNGVLQDPPACEPPPPPHNVNSSLQHVTGISISSQCVNNGFNSFFGNSNEPQQGPYSAQNDFVTQSNQITANNVSWSEIILIEIYEADDGSLINDDLTPEYLEGYNGWAMYSGNRPVTNNVYPKYVKAFVYLSFDSNGITGLIPGSLTTLNLDIDEVEPTYGCTNPIAMNYNSSATIDDNSCVLPPTDYGVNVSATVVNNGPGGVAAGPYTSGQGFTDLSGANFNTIIFPHQINMQQPPTVTLQNRYNPGDHVNEVVQFVIYPNSILTFGNNNFSLIYDYPLPGGPGANISQTDGYQQNPGGWGNSKNNLTAASLMIQDPDSFSWNSANYQTFNNYSYWHNGIDPTGLQPSFTVGFDNFNSTSAILATEIYDTSSPYPALDYFPEYLVLDVLLDFYLPGGNNMPSNMEYDMNFNIFHNTENQGDFDWTTPPPEDYDGDAGDGESDEGGG